MRKLFFIMLSACLVFCSIASAQNNREVTERQIDYAINTGIKYLKDTQAENGTWGSKEGHTSLALLALVYSEKLEKDDEAIQKAVTYLLANAKYTRVYDTALLAIALQELDPVRHKHIIARCAKFLEDAQLPNGMWAYTKLDNKQWLKDRAGNDNGGHQQGNDNNGNDENDENDNNGENNPDKKKERVPGDNSNTQFAILGLRAAIQAGVEVKMSVINKAQMHFVSTQAEDGGWGYKSSASKGTGAMTCAGLGSLFICSETFHAGQLRERQEIRNNHVKKGLDWISSNFAVNSNANGKRNYFYYMYSVERVGILSGQKYYGDHNWYREGATQLISLQNGNGSWTEGKGDSDACQNTSFALLFLGKGLVPTVFKVWNTGDEDLDEAHNPLPEIAEHMRDNGGHRMNWQNVSSSQARVKDMLESPALFVSGQKAMTVKEEDTEKLRQYVEGGGMILACAAKNSRAFDKSFKEMLQKVLPGSELKKLPPEHPIYNGKYKIVPYAQTLQAVETATRPLVIYSDKDLFSSKAKNSKGELSPTYQLAANIADFLASDKDNLSRLKEFDDVQEDATVAAKAVKIAQLLPEENAQPVHPKGMLRLLAFTRQKRNLRNLAVKNYFVSTKDENLKDYKIIYMTGASKKDFTKEEIEALKKYIENGGTIFADAALGNVEYDQSFRSLVTKITGKNLQRVDNKDSVLKGSSKGGFDIQNVLYRSAVLEEKEDEKYNEPYLEAVIINKRPVIIYSKYDLGCGWEGFPSYRNLGVRSKSAFKIGANIIIRIADGVK